MSNTVMIGYANKGHDGFVGQGDSGIQSRNFRIRSVGYFAHIYVGNN